MRRTQGRSIDWPVPGPIVIVSIPIIARNSRATRGQRLMQFGVQFFPSLDHTDKSAADYYAESISLAEEAEKLGFTHARTVEHYFTRYGGYRSEERRVGKECRNRWCRSS